MKILIIVIILIAAGFVGWKVFNSSNENEMPDDTENVQNGSDLVGGDSTEVKGQVAQYFAGAEGFYVEPIAAGSYPGVVMIHEWWGLNDNIRAMAKTLASQGYRVLAVDLYGGKVAATSAEAQQYVGAVNKTEAVQNLRAAAKYLRDKGSAKVASLGWCFGGGQSLALALSGEKLDATVIYYGTPLVTDKNELADISWPILGIFGDKDTSIPVEQVKEFESSLIVNDIRNEIYIYPGVGHAFANPSGANYAPNETVDAWAKTLVFLNSNLK